MLANPGYDRQPVKTVLFFAGQPLDGTSLPENGCGESCNGLGCYSVHPSDAVHLEWRNPVNRLLVADEIVRAGFNTISMSTWGESWLPCTADCSWMSDEEYRKEPRCSVPCSQSGGGNGKRCRIGWYGSANMQVSPAAKNQLFNAVAKKRVLIMPFIESRFGFDWDFHDEFPRSPANNKLAPGLVSQLLDLIDVYLVHPANAAWPAKWAQVYDQNNEPRYAVVIIQAASSVLQPNDDERFAKGFTEVADTIFQLTGKKVGFFIDPIPRDPTSTFGVAGITEMPISTYGASFKPDPLTTGPFLQQQACILGIHAYSPEGWIDGRPNSGKKVNEAYKLAWKKEWSKQWFETGIPFLQDVTPGYDANKLFQNEPDAASRLYSWGNNDTWRRELFELVKTHGAKGFVYNSWNGYCEGLAGMSTAEYKDVNVNWIKSIVGLYR